MNLINGLLELAFDGGPARQANWLIESVRRRMVVEAGSAVSYEVVLFDRDWSYVQQIVAPRLALYLKSKRLGAIHCPGVFMTVFRGDRVSFIRAAEFYEYYRTTLGLDPRRFCQLTKAWERTGKPVAGLLSAG